MYIHTFKDFAFNKLGKRISYFLPFTSPFPLILLTHFLKRRECSLVHFASKGNVTLSLWSNTNNGNNFKRLPIALMEQMHVHSSGFCFCHPPSAARLLRRGESRACTRPRLCTPTCAVYTHVLERSLQCLLCCPAALFGLVFCQSELSSL